MLSAIINPGVTALSAGANSVAAGEVIFSNSNAVSFGLTGSTITGTVATTYLGSNASTNYVQANATFNGTNCSGTIASNNISVSVLAQSNQTLGLYGLGNT